MHAIISAVSPVIRMWNAINYADNRHIFNEVPLIFSLKVRWWQLARMHLMRAFNTTTWNVFSSLLIKNLNTCSSNSMERKSRGILTWTRTNMSRETSEWKHFFVLLLHFQVLYVDTNTIVKGSAIEGNSSTGIFRLIGCHQDPPLFSLLSW